MTFTIDKFLKPINQGDKNIIIYDDNGKVIHTINPYSVINTFVNNNLVKISLASDRIITLNFITSDFAKRSLKLVQERIEVLKNLNPLFIDKQVEKYVEDVVDKQRKVIDNIVEGASGKVGYVPRWISATALSATSSIFDTGKNVRIGFTSSTGLIPSSGKGLFSVQDNYLSPTFSLNRDYGPNLPAGDYFNGYYGPSHSTFIIEGIHGGLATPRVINPGKFGLPTSWITDPEPLARIVGSGSGTTLRVENVAPYRFKGQIGGSLANRTGGLVSGPSIVTHFAGTDPVFVWEHKDQKRLRLESTSTRWDFWSEAIIPGVQNEITFQNSGPATWELVVTQDIATGSTEIPHTRPEYANSAVGYFISGAPYSTYSFVSKDDISDIITFSSHAFLGQGMIITGSKRLPNNSVSEFFPFNTRIAFLFPDGQTVRLTNPVTYTFSTTDLLTVSGPIFPNTKITGPVTAPGGYLGARISNGTLRKISAGESIFYTATRGTVYFGGGVGIGSAIRSNEVAAGIIFNVGGLANISRLQSSTFKLIPNSTRDVEMFAGASPSSFNVLVGDSSGESKWLPASRLSGSGFTGTSSTEITIGNVGNYFKVQTQPYLSFTPGQIVVLYDQLDALYVTPSYVEGFGKNKILAEVDGYNIGSGTLSLVTLYSQNVGSVSSSWQISLSGAVGPQGPAGFNQGTFSVSGDIIPTLDYTFNLGSTTSRWANIYVKDAIVASQSLFIGNIKISEEQDIIKVNERAINKYEGTSSTPYTIGVSGDLVTLRTNRSLSYLQGDSIKVQNQLKNYYEEDGYSEGSEHGFFVGMVDQYNKSTGDIEIIVTYVNKTGFSSDSWVLKLNSDTFGFENDLTVNVDGLKLVGTSTDEFTIPSVGEVREFSTQEKLGFYAGQTVIVYNELPNNYEDDDYVEGNGRYFIGKVDFYYSETGILTVIADYVNGTGTYSNWTITVSSIPNNGSGGPQGATGPQGEVGATGPSGPQGETGPAGPLGTTASFEELTVTGPSNIQQVIEVLTTATATGLSSSTFNLDFDNGSIFYVEPEGDNFVANYLNVPTIDNRIISTTIIISQTASAYIPNVVAINGDIIPISWSSGSLPSGNPNQTDIVGFSFMRIGATWSKVFGQLSTFNTI